MGITGTSIVSAEWLKDHLHDPDVRTVDASWHLPAAGRDARREFDSGHIPGAVYFDIDEHSTPSHLPHMLPDAKQFARAAGLLGIAEHHTIVIYDAMGMFSAARVWWMFRHFGASQVCVLDGGLPAWTRAGGELETARIEEPVGTPAGKDTRSKTCQFTISTRAAGHSAASEGTFAVVNSADVRNAMRTGGAILDARSAGRFTGEEPEARQGLRSGHIPGSINVPFSQVLDDKGCFRSDDELIALFDSLELSTDDRIITTCGSGVTAAVLCLALERAGYQSLGLYDGSWSEWGALDGVPVATGNDGSTAAPFV